MPAIYTLKLLEEYPILTIYNVYLSISYHKGTSRGISQGTRESEYFGFCAVGDGVYLVGDLARHCGELWKLAHQKSSEESLM